MRRRWRYTQRASDAIGAGCWRKWTRRGELITREDADGAGHWIVLNKDGRYTVGDDEGWECTLEKSMIAAEERERALRAEERKRALAWEKHEREVLAAAEEEFTDEG